MAKRRRENRKLVRHEESCFFKATVRALIVYLENPNRLFSSRLTYSRAHFPSFSSHRFLSFPVSVHSLLFPPHPTPEPPTVRFLSRLRVPFPLSIRYTWKFMSAPCHSIFLSLLKQTPCAPFIAIADGFDSK